MAASKNKQKEILIALGYDISKFKQESTAINAEISKTTKSANTLEKSLKLNYNNDTFIKAQNKAEQAVAATQKKVDLLKEHLSKLDKDSDTEVVRKEYEKLSSMLETAEQKAEQARQQLERINNIKLDKIQEQIASAGDKLTSIGAKLTLGLTTPLVAAGVASYNYAADTAESISKAEVTFGNCASAIKQLADVSLEQYGLSKQTIYNWTSLYGDMGTAMGQTKQEAADMSIELTKRLADVMSFKNVSAEAAETIGKALYSGQSQPLKNIGVIMNETTLAAYAAAEGYEKLYSEMNQLEKLQVRVAYFMSATNNANGDFARTAESASNQMKILKQSIIELATNFGDTLAPAITPFIKNINSLLEKFASMSDGAKQNIVQFAAWAALLGPLTTLMGGLAKTTNTAVSAYRYIIKKKNEHAAATTAETAAETANTAATKVNTAAHTEDAAANTADAEAVLANTAAKEENTAVSGAEAAAEATDTTAKMENTAATTAETVAETENTAATGANTTAQAAGTAAEAIDTAATAANTTATGAATAAENVNTTATNANTAAKEANAAASTLLTGGLGSLISIIGLATAAIAAFAISSSLFSDSADDMTDSIYDTEAAYERFQNTLKNSKSTFDESTKSAETQARSLELLTDKLFELNSRSEKTAGTQKQMQTIIDQLNDGVDGLNLAIDKNTGNLNMNEQAIRGVIAAQKEMMISNAYQQYAQSTADSLAEAEINLDNLLDKYNVTADGVEAWVARMKEIYETAGKNTLYPDARWAKSVEEEIGQNLNTIVKDYLIYKEYVEKIEKLQSDLDKTLSKSSSSSASSSIITSISASDYDTELKLIEYKYKMGLMSSKKYLIELRRLRNEYLTKDTEEWRNANLEILSVSKQVQQEQQALAQQSAQMLKDAYSEQKSIASYYHNMGTYSDQQYYNKLASLRDQYLSTNTEEWRSATVELKNLQDSIQKEAYESQKSLVEYYHSMGTYSDKTYYDKLSALRDQYLTKNTEEWRSATLALKNLQESMTKTAYDKQKSIIEYYHNMGTYSDKTYYDKLSALRNQYLTKNTEEWRNATLELKRLQDQMKADAAQATQDRYNELKSIAAYHHEMGIINDEFYYEKLERLRDYYLTKNTEEWRNATLELKRLQDQMRQEAERAAEEAAEAERNAQQQALSDYREYVDAQLKLAREQANEKLALIDKEIAARRELQEQDKLDKQLAQAEAKLKYEKDENNRKELEKEIARLKGELEEREYQKEMQSRKDAIESAYEEAEKAAQALVDKYAKLIGEKGYNYNPTVENFNTSNSATIINQMAGLTAAMIEEIIRKELKAAGVI